MIRSYETSFTVRKVQKSILHAFIASGDEESLFDLISISTADYLHISYQEDTGRDISNLVKRIETSGGVSAYMSTDKFPSMIVVRDAFVTCISQLRILEGNIVEKLIKYLDEARLFGWTEVSSWDAFFGEQKRAQNKETVIVSHEEDLSFTVDDIHFKHEAVRSDFSSYQRAADIQALQHLIQQSVQFLNSGMHDSGLKILTDLLHVKEFRKIPEIYILKASAECQIGKFEDAMRSINVAKEGRPESPDVQNMFQHIKKQLNLP